MIFQKNRYFDMAWLYPNEFCCSKNLEIFDSELFTW